MKIPNSLPQFKNETAFIIVAGRQDAVFYQAHNGSIDCLDTFKVPTPEYSDRAGEFKQSGRGTTISSGSVREIRHQSIIQSFIHEFKKRIKKIPEFSNIYIFAPGQTKNKIVAALPTPWRPKVKDVVEGNYFYHHPLFLLRKITRFAFT